MLESLFHQVEGGFFIMDTCNGNEISGQIFVKDKLTNSSYSHFEFKSYSEQTVFQVTEQPPQKLHRVQ